MAMAEVAVEKAKGRVKKFRGQPATGGDWVLIGDVGEAYGVGWRLYARPASHGWRNMKLASTNWAPNKANYWISWNGDRLAVTKDQKKMDTGKPELREKLLAFIARTPGL